MNNIFSHIKYVFTTVAGLTDLIAGLILIKILGDAGFTSLEATLIDMPFLMLIDWLRGCVGLKQEYVKK